MKEEEFLAEIWRIWKEVHSCIGPIREEAYKISCYRTTHDNKRFLRQARQTTPLQEVDEEQDNTPPNTNGSLLNDLINSLHNDLIKYLEKPEDDDPSHLGIFAEKAQQLAREVQSRIEKKKKVKPDDVLFITTWAGRLLSHTEVITYRYERLKEKKAKVPTTTLSMTMTVVATARDCISAADGHVKNLKEEIGTKEQRDLGKYLLVVIVPYLLFHPILQQWFSVPLQYRPYWEIIFWSLLGAISISTITIAEDVHRDRFDPRHIGKYTYRIQLAPIVATVLILFGNVVGFVLMPGGTDSSAHFIDLSNPDFPFLVVLSFLFGFFGKRALEILDIAWRRLIPSARKEEKQEPSTTQKEIQEPYTA